MAEAIKAAGKTDAVQDRYWSGKTNLLKNLKESLAELRANDKKAWTQFLSILLSNENPMFQEFKAISPFKNQMLLVVDYGCGFVTIRGDFQKWLDRLIKEKGGRTIYDADSYFIAMPVPDMEKAKVE